MESVERFVVRDFAFLTNFAGSPATGWAGPPAGNFSEGKIEFSQKINNLRSTNALSFQLFYSELQRPARVLVNSAKY